MLHFYSSNPRNDNSGLKALADICSQPYEDVRNALCWHAMRIPLSVFVEYLNEQGFATKVLEEKTLVWPDTLFKFLRFRSARFSWPLYNQPGSFAVIALKDGVYHVISYNNTQSKSVSCIDKPDYIISVYNPKGEKHEV